MISKVIQLPISSKNVTKPEGANAGSEGEHSFDELLGKTSEVQPEKPDEEQDKEKTPVVEGNVNASSYVVLFAEQLQIMPPKEQMAAMPALFQGSQPAAAEGILPGISQTEGVPVTESADMPAAKEAAEILTDMGKPITAAEETLKGQTSASALPDGRQQVEGKKNEAASDGVKFSEAEKGQILPEKVSGKVSEQYRVTEAPEKPAVKEPVVGAEKPQESKISTEEPAVRENPVISNELPELFAAGNEKIRNSEVPVKETVSWNSSEAEVNRKNLSEALLKNIVSGKREFELQLEPQNLGKVAVKISYEAGKTSISIICNSTKTLEAMSQNARELGTMLETRLGVPTTVLVDKSEPDYLNQQQQHQQGQEEHAGNSSKDRERKEAESLDFLQQLRLGMVVQERQKLV